MAAICAAAPLALANQLQLPMIVQRGWLRHCVSSAIEESDLYCDRIWKTLHLWGCRGQVWYRGWGVPRCFFWVFSKRSITKPDPCGKYIIQQESFTILGHCRTKRQRGRQVTVSLAILNLVELNLHARPCPQYSRCLCWKRTLISERTNEPVLCRGFSLDSVVHVNQNVLRVVILFTVVL